MFKNKVDTSQEGGLHMSQKGGLHMSQEGGLHIDEKRINKPMTSLSICHLGLWLGWQMLLILVTNLMCHV